MPSKKQALMMFANKYITDAPLNLTLEKLLQPLFSCFSFVCVYVCVVYKKEREKLNSGINNSKRKKLRK